MILRNVNYGKAFCSAGALGFFGEGYWQYQFLKLLGLNFSGATLVTKTITLLPQKRDLLLDKHYHPIEFFPKSIKVNFLEGLVAYPSKVSNPGSLFVINDNRLRSQKKPFFISYAPSSITEENRLSEFLMFLSVLKIRLEDFSVPIGLEVNINSKMSVAEIRSMLSMSKRLGTPIVPNFAVDTSTEFMLEIMMSKDCEAISIANSISHESNWQKIWKEKPKGEWKISGAPLLPIVEAKVRFLSKKINKPIVAGGGVLCKDDAAILLNAGAAAVKLSSVAILRPWRVRGIIKLLNSIA